MMTYVVKVYNGGKLVREIPFMVYGPALKCAQKIERSGEGVAVVESVK